MTSCPTTNIFFAAFRAALSVSKLVNSLKGVSSRYLKTNFPELEKYYCGNAFMVSYITLLVVVAVYSLEIIKEYISSQETLN